MADRRIVQKDEMRIGHAPWPRVERKPDAAIRLLLDCFESCPDAKLSNVTHMTEVIT